MADPATRTEPTQARDPRHVEQVLAKIWAEVLDVPEVDGDANFFDLGGHSLLATHVDWRARTTGLDVPMRLIFEHPTLSELARVVASGSADA
jgi:mycobactin peptide synthetase MbtE